MVEDALVDRYSNYGSTVEILAPGGNTQRDDDGNGFGDGVLSITGRGYEYYNGDFYGISACCWCTCFMAGG